MTEEPAVTKIVTLPLDYYSNIKPLFLGNHSVMTLKLNTVAAQPIYSSGNSCLNCLLLHNMDEVALQSFLQQELKNHISSLYTATYTQEN